MSENSSLSNKEYSSGHVIVSCKPFAHVLCSKEKSKRCDYCFKMSDSLNRCSKCKAMFYCDIKCQRKDWKCHRFECQLYKKLSEFELNPFDSDCERFTLRLWFLINSNESIASEKFKTHNGIERCFNDLKTHKTEISNDTKRMAFFNRMCDKFQYMDIDFIRDDIFFIYCCICINSFSILNDDLNEIGTGIYIPASVFDHSCDPNAAHVFNGIDLELRALKTIKPNDNVCVNYIDIKDPKEERQLKLKQQYYFDCKCIKCETQCDARIDYSLVKRLDQQFDDLITEGNDWESAHLIGVKSLPIYESIYGNYHPDLTVQLLRIAKIKVLTVKSLSSDESILNLISRINDSLRVTHGERHNLYKMFLNSCNNWGIQLY